MPVKINDGPQAVRRYKHSMRKSPYLVSLVFLLAATALTLLNIYAGPLFAEATGTDGQVPKLIHVTVRSPGPLEFETQYGLYQRCTRATPVANSSFLAPSHPLPSPAELSLSSAPTADYQAVDDTADSEWKCQAFPTRSECAEFGEQFCVLWSTSGYAAQLSLVPCLAALVSLLFIFLHRGQRTARARARRQQWKLVSGTMGIHCALQIVSIALILHVFRTDERFEAKGSHLDQSFTFGVCSAVVSALMALLLTFTGLAARAGKPWAAGTSARKARRHRRTRSGKVVPVPPGTEIPPEQAVTVGEVEAAIPAAGATERTALLEGHEGDVAGGGEQRATD